MKHYLIVLMFSAITFNSTVYGQSNNEENDSIPKLEPFELEIYDSNYSMAYSYQYKLNEKDLTIVFIGGLVGEKDSIYYKMKLNPNETFSQISKSNYDSLKSKYNNPCVEDGSQLTVIFNKSNKSKTIHLSNYYQPDIGIVVEYVNTIVPEKFKIRYNKEKLLQSQYDCDHGK